jgi:hypothetical protein
MGPATANGTIGNARLSADLGSLRLGVRKLRSLQFVPAALCEYRRKWLGARRF